MKFCDDHWDRLREKIEERGLGHLIPTDAEVVVAQELDQFERDGEPTGTNFNPLMRAHWAITTNVLGMIPRATGYLMQGPDVPEDRVGMDAGLNALRYTSRTWPRCPLCYLNLAHAVTCTGCSLPTEGGYDWMLDKAADEMKEIAASL